MSGKSERNAYGKSIYNSLANKHARSSTLNLGQEKHQLEPVKIKNLTGSRWFSLGTTLAMVGLGSLGVDFLGSASLIQPGLIQPGLILPGFIQPVLAQGSPLPGSANYKPASSAPVPGSNGFNKPMSPEETMRSRYKSLPITAADAKIRLEELRSALEMGTPPRELQERVLELGEWLTDAADAHYRMYQAFAKSELTKNQAASEKQLNQSFSQLKREAQLLKADLLIKQGRGPEALSPLVEIVVNDPRSQTGQAAYKKLTELGFSRDVSEDKQISGLEAPKPAK
ncbi:MAG: hypothetical protein K2Y32_06715 [Candidatus Obscuribacterales bacterium]|nr:hypothetical protein [Candidatus Obscuribacterales bacterium]